MRVAIVGCGTIANMHADALKQTDDITLVACCDILPQRAEEMAKPFGANVYTDYCTMLDTEVLDAVHICTPHYIHLEMAEQAADRGIAVFTEKPPVITWEQWERFSSLEGRVPVGICFQNRYNPESILLRDLAQSKHIGTIQGGKAMVTWSRSRAYYDSAQWRGGLTTEGGGVLINQAIHTLDLLVRCLGEPDSIQANASNYHLQDCIEVEDTMDAYLQYPNGKTALFYATTAYAANSPVQIELVSDKGTFRMEEGTLTCLWNDGKVETIKPAPLKRTADGQDYWGHAHTVCIQDFYDALKNKRPYQNDIASVVPTMRTTLGIYQAAREHKVVTL